MKKTILFISFIALIASCSSDYRVKTLRGESPTKEMYKFPLLDGGNPVICQSINNELSELYLNIQVGTEKESLFEKVWSSNVNSIPERTDIDFSVKHLDTRLYSLNITGFYIGAYLNEIDDYLNFDLRTGKRVQMDSLFTIEGKQEVIKRLSAYKRKLMNEKIDLALHKLNEVSLPMSEREHFAEMYDLYKNCPNQVDALNYIGFYKKKDSIYFRIESCALQYNKAVDEIGNFEFALPLSALKDQYSNYGRELLL